MVSYLNIFVWKLSKIAAKKKVYFADFAGLFQWGGYITTWGGYIEIWGGYIGKMRVLGYSWSTLLWHRCYYPHRLRDSVFPVCRIFFLWFKNLAASITTNHRVITYILNFRAPRMGKFIKEFISLILYLWP